MKKHDLVFELGTEEIPAGYLPPAANQLCEAARGFLSEHRLEADGVETHATPRRLVLVVRGLPEAQEDRTEEVTGPPWKAAFDAEGNPTKAAEGFARGRGLDVKDLRQVETDRGPYVGATVTISGRPTVDLLAAALPEMTAALAFPKTMVWGPSRFRFARPIRWILALFGSDVVPFEIEGVASDRATYGHRILAKGPFTVKKAGDYEKALEKGRVVLRASDRQERIGELLAATAKEAGGSLISDPALVEEVSYLVETPSAFVSDFDEEFLQLPAPVVKTAMRDHQRYFAVEDSRGKLLPRFLCVANSAPESVDQVNEGNRRVLRARLDDARFYWNEDLKTKLADKVPQLGAVVWLEGFGSLEDKTRRLEKLASGLADTVAPDEKDIVARAALLAKTDLVTEMIRDGKEFTSLQGVMGREYALENGEPAGVALALEEQYRPRFAGDDLPSSAPGAALALADRVDTMVGVWAAGLRPTASKDPFALRRGALGVIRILLDRGLSLRIEDLVDRAADEYGDLLSDRAVTLLHGRRGVRRRRRRGGRAGRGRQSARRPGPLRSARLAPFRAPRGLRGARRRFQAREEHPEERPGGGCAHGGPSRRGRGARALRSVPGDRRRGRGGRARPALPRRVRGPRPAARAHRRLLRLGHGPHGRRRPPREPVAAARAHRRSSAGSRGSFSSRGPGGDDRVIARGGLVAAVGLLVLLAACSRDPAPPSVRLVIVGTDGADWDRAIPLLRQGKLPALARLARTGTRRTLRSLEPERLSPTIWTTVATGMLPEQHGIHHFVTGDAESFQPVTSNQRETAALWNILSARGRTVGVLGWLVTWPAEPVNGWLVSSYTPYVFNWGASRPMKGTLVEGMPNQVWPPELQPTLEALKVRPEDVGTDELRARFTRAEIPGSPAADAAESLEGMRWSWATDETYRRIRRYLVEHPPGGRRPEVELLYLSSVDVISHRFWKYMDPGSWREGPVPASEVDAYGRSIENAYRSFDGVLAEILAAETDSVRVMVLSDHGFRANRDPKRATSSGWHRPEGVFLAEGPGILAGGLAAPGSVVDVAPTVLYSLGLPVADDMDGEAALELFEADFRRERKLERIPSWEPEAGRVREEAPVVSPVDAEILSRLKSLGYLE